MRHGYTVVWCGWQHDVPAVDGLMRIAVPEARQGGDPVSGRLLVSSQPNAPSQVQLLSDRGHRPYSSSNLHEPDAALLVRDGEDAPARVIPRHEWSFARLDGGRVVPDVDHVYLAAGFVPGKIYHVAYTTTGAPVIGLGLLAPRDTVGFLRHGSAENGNPCAVTFGGRMPSARRKAGGICGSFSTSASTRTKRSTSSSTASSSTSPAVSVAATLTNALASPRPRSIRQ